MGPTSNCLLAATREVGGKTTGRQLVDPGKSPRLIEGHRAEVAVPRKEVVAVGELLVDLDVALIVIRGHANVGDKVVSSERPGNRGVREEVGVVLAHRIDATCFDHVGCDAACFGRDHRSGIAQRGQSGEIAPPHRRSGDGGRKSAGLANAQEGEIGKEEGLVEPVIQLGDHHWAAEGKPTLVLHEVALLDSVAVGEEVVGVQGRVAQEVIHVTVQ